MLTEDYCDFETAKLLKEKGFPQNIITKELVLIRDCSFNVNGSLVHNSAGYTLPYEHYSHRIHKDNWANIPTLQRACKWLRVEHNLYIEPMVIKNYDKRKLEYTYTIQDLNFPGSDDGIDSCKNWDTPEEAIGEAIKYCLEKLI